MRVEGLTNGPLPVEVVFHPSWWHTHGGISFDEDFFYHPARRVEAERQMERVLYERFGDLGLGEDRDADRPVVGAVHNAAGYLVSEMLGCPVAYTEAAPPLVNPAERSDQAPDADAAFASPAWRRFRALIDALKSRFGYLTGDVNWAGLLNLALDLRGQDVLYDMIVRPAKVHELVAQLRAVIERFADEVARETGTTSISVNRTVRHLAPPVFLHSECALTMISAAHYEQYFLPCDSAWSARHRPFGIHCCGADAHRFADSFAKIPHLDLLDVGWGSDVGRLRQKLPRTFLNIRLSPVEIVDQTTDEIRNAIVTRVRDSGNPYLTGVCCINMDDRVTDDKVRAIFETVFELRTELAPGGGPVAQ